MRQEAVESKAYFFRPYIENDIPFIQSSWASSYYKGARYNELLTPEEFHLHHRPIREAFFKRGSSAVIICASIEDQDLIIGWIAVEKPKSSPGLILHYLYVKQAFKGEHIASELIGRALPTEPIMFTHLTEKAAKLMNKDLKRFNNYFYAPHLT